jgi:hypothetical protein
VTEKQKAWVKWLHLGGYYYNTTYHMSSGMFPFRALYSYDPPTFVEWIHESRDILRELKDHLQRAQNQHKLYVDRYIVEHTF